MAKVIEFYVPKSFRNAFVRTAQPQPGKVIEFCSQAKKSVPTRPSGQGRTARSGGFGRRRERCSFNRKTRALGDDRSHGRGKMASPLQRVAPRLSRLHLARQ